MVRLAPPLFLAFSVLATSAHAATGRATVAVSLKIEPTCAAKAAPQIKSGEPKVGIACATQPPPTTGEPSGKAAYVVRTIRRPEGTVVSFEF